MVTEGPTLTKTTCPRGDCIIFNYEVKTKKCGIKQNISITDTIYEIKYDAPVHRYLTPITGENSYEERYLNIQGGDSQTSNIISTLQPILQISGEGFTFETIDRGENPNYTNRSLPFHNWDIVVKAEKNHTDHPREGNLNLLDSYGNILQTISLLTFNTENEE